MGRDQSVCEKGPYHRKASRCGPCSGCLQACEVCSAGKLCPDIVEDNGTDEVDHKGVQIIQGPGVPRRGEAVTKEDAEL